MAKKKTVSLNDRYRYIALTLLIAKLGKERAIERDELRKYTQQSLEDTGWTDLKPTKSNYDAMRAFMGSMIRHYPTREKLLAKRDTLDIPPFKKEEKEVSTPDYIIPISRRQDCVREYMRTFSSQPMAKNEHIATCMEMVGIPINTNTINDMRGYIIEARIKEGKKRVDEDENLRTQGTKSDHWKPEDKPYDTLIEEQAKANLDAENTKEQELYFAKPSLWTRFKRALGFE